MLGIVIILVGLVIAYHAGGFWWLLAIANAWTLGVMFNYRRDERAPRWTGIAIPLTLALIVKGILLFADTHRSP